MRALLAILLGFSLTASAGTVSRLYDFEPGTKAEADKVDAEFDNIISTLNGNINSANILDGGIATADLGTNSVTGVKIVDGAITRSKVASGASAYIKDYRKGCTLFPIQFQSPTVTQSVSVSTPCQIIVDGWVGELSATATVGALDTGAFAGNKVYYVYGTVNGNNGIDFLFSVSTPNTTTFRHPSSTSRRYIGSVMTNATASIAHFRQTGNLYKVIKDTFLATYVDFVNVVSSSNVVTTQVNVPPFAVAVRGNLTADLTPDGYCAAEFYALDAIDRLTDFIAPRVDDLNVGSTNEREDIRVPINRKAVQYTNICNTPGSLAFFIRGWEEPAELY